MENLKDLKKDLEESMKEKCKIDEKIEYIQKRIDELNAPHKYEMVYILAPDCSAKSMSEIQYEIFRIISYVNISNIEHHGIRKLAYEIKKYDEGYFITMDFKQKLETIPALEKIFRKNNNVLKFIIIKKEEEKINE